jgi:tRNA pseudouridine55 synthase
MGLDKAYETVARLGALSSTGDVEGEIVETGRVPPAHAALPLGEVRQRPPAYSAVKIAGRRAYALARAGEAVEPPERTVRVHAFTEMWRQEEAAGGPRAAYRIRCSSGTYVRSLIADLRDAYCLELRRTAIGPFRVAEADPARPLSLADALADVLPTVTLGEGDVRAAGHGRSVAAPAAAALGGSEHVLLTDAAGPVAIAQLRDGLLKPVVGFRG